MLQLDPTEPHTAWLSLLSRRAILRTSLFGMGSFAGVRALDARPSASQASRSADTACIVFFLDGGPSHHDTFDPKPDAPSEVRGEFGVIDTTVPGMMISDRLPLLARHAEHYSLLRSLHHGNPSHAPAEHQMLTGWMGSRPGTARAVIETPSLGSVVSKLRGTGKKGLPAYVAMPWSFHHEYGGSPFGASSYLGPRYEPFESGSLPKSATAAYEVPALKFPEGVSKLRLENRRRLLDRIDRYATDDVRRESIGRARAIGSEALDMLVEENVRHAFDLGKEPQRLREQYGAHEWGQSALLARRLVEAGVNFVMIQCGLRQDWDTHDTNFVKLKDKLLPPLDRAVSSLLADLVDRGRFDKTLVMVVGEFGRTPIINKKAGRDHWANVFSALVAGGGLRGGQVVGVSDKTGAYPHQRPLHAKDLFATMYGVLGIDHHNLFHDLQGRPVPVLNHGTSIEELL
jgi:hypothetical protein